MFDEYLDVWSLLKLIGGFNNLYKKLYNLCFIIGGNLFKVVFFIFCIVKFYKYF